MVKKKNENTVVGIIESFVNASKSYKEDTLRFATHMRDKLYDLEEKLTRDDIVRAIAGIPNPHVSYQSVLNEAVDAIQSLPDMENTNVAVAKLEKNKQVVRNRMKHAYEDAVKVIEPIALRYCVDQYGFSDEFEELSDEAMSNIYWLVWGKAISAVCGSNFPKVSDWIAIMSAFDTSLEIADVSVSEAVRSMSK